MYARQMFDVELEELSAALITMGAMATESIDKTIMAINTGNRQMAETVFKGDDLIDDMEKKIEHRCLRLLLKQQPVASDLRKISTAIKMITDIERIGDASSDIAEICMSCENSPTGELLEDITKMAEAGRSVVSDSIKAYVDEDLELAKKTIDADDIVDDYFDSIKTILIDKIRTEPERSGDFIDYLMIIKYLERIGDHAVNICEWVQFYKTGMHKNERIV